MRLADYKYLFFVRCRITLKCFMGRGYGVSPQAAFDAAGRVEMSGCSIPVLQTELENLALVM